MKMSNRLYDVLKYIVTIVSPALITAITALGALYGWDNVEVMSGTIAVVTTFVGALIGVSSHNYNKSLKEDE